MTALKNVSGCRRWKTSSWMRLSSVSLKMTLASSSSFSARSRYRVEATPDGPLDYGIKGCRVENRKMFGHHLLSYVVVIRQKELLEFLWRENLRVEGKERPVRGGIHGDFSFLRMRGKDCEVKV